jgi:aspartate carbamoyltransferase catalytic subunit
MLPHLLGLEGMPRERIVSLLDLARTMKSIVERPIPKVPTLRGRTVANLFFEPSTRTRFSFELAEKRLSADVLSFAAAGTSVVKGETLADTVRTIEAMGVHVVVLRHNAAGAAAFVARHVDAAVVNAGDGAHEHPTQGLLDLYTVHEALGRIEGLRVAILGDIAHSRVARSDIIGFSALGAKVTVCGPRTLLPAEVERLGVNVVDRVEDALDGTNVVIVLRLQRERQASALLPSLHEYFQVYGLTRERASLLAEDALILHPGPMNRGVEIAPEVADGPHSLIIDQVTNGVAVRMAVLCALEGVDSSPEVERLRTEVAHA